LEGIQRSVSWPRLPEPLSLTSPHPSGVPETKEKGDPANNYEVRLIMSLIPGWTSAAGAGLWSTIFFWAGIVALLFLGISEVISHRYGERKDELGSEQQVATEQRHDEEMARLHLETAKANERSAALEKDAAELKSSNLALERQIAPRQLKSEYIERLVLILRRHPGETIVIESYVLRCGSRLLWGGAYKNIADRKFPVR